MFIFKDLTPKKVVFFPEIGRVKFFLSLARPHSRMCIRISEYTFLIKKKQTKKKNQKKLKKLKKKTEYLWKVN